MSTTFEKKEARKDLEKITTLLDLKFENINMNNFSQHEI